MRVSRKTTFVINPQASKASRRTRTSAITLIELLIVIAIVSILAGISFPAMRQAFDAFELDNFVKDLYFLSYYLQEKAVLEKKIHCLNIHKDSQPIEFQARYQKEVNLWEPVAGRFGRVDKAPAGISLFSTEPPELKEIYFYPDASIDEITLTFQNSFGKASALIIKGAGSEIQVK